LPAAVGRAAHESNSERVLQWLKSQPPSPIRSASVAAVASILQFRVVNRIESRDRVQERFKSLCELVDSIEDPATKWKAVDSTVSLAKALQLPHQALLEEWRELWAMLPEVRSEVVQHWDFGRLPLDEQNRQISESFEPGGQKHWKREELSPWLTLEMVHKSSLPAAKKRSLYQQINDQAEVPLASAAVARYLAWHDYADALKLVWKTLPTPRNPRMPYIDTNPSMDRPLNARAALDWIQEGRKAFAQGGEADKVVAALWSHANSVPGSDRSAVMEELARTLLEDGQHAKALGVAPEITDLPRRLVLLAEIANAAVKTS
jgi:hypothetical protein